MFQLKSEIKHHLLIAFLWLGFVSVARWSWQPSLIFFWLGGFLGAFLLNIDHLFYTLLVRPHELTSVRVRRFWDQHQYKDMLLLLAQTHKERIRLNFHNAPFQAFLCILSFFVLTSSNSLFGAGLVLGMGLHLLMDEAGDFLRGEQEYLRSWLFWPISGRISFSQQKIFLITMALVFLGLNFFLV